MTYKSSYDAEMAGLKFNDEMKQAIADASVIKQAINTLRRKELEIKLEKNTLESALEKADENIRRLRIEISDAKTIFWQLKNDNL